MPSDRSTQILEFAFNDGNNAFDINIQDQTTPIVDLLFFRNDGEFTLASPAVVGERTFTAETSHGITVGDVVCFQEGQRFMQAIATAVDVNDITIDTPFDYAFSESGGCSQGSRNMAVNGSSTPVVFAIGPGNLEDGTKWDITRVIIVIIDNSAMDDGKFGGLTALANGIVVRSNNGIMKNIFNAKTNGDFKLRNLDGIYTDATLGPSGNYSFTTRRTFAGQEKNGVVIRLSADNDDKLEIVIQDNLTGLVGMYATAQGHVVD